MDCKPIVIFRVPNLVGIEDIRGSLEKKMFDYHVFVIPTGDNDIDIQALYEKDFTHIQYEELKELLLKEIKSTKDES